MRGTQISWRTTDSLIFEITEVSSCFLARMLIRDQAGAKIRSKTRETRGSNLITQTRAWYPRSSHTHSPQGPHVNCRLAAINIHAKVLLDWPLLMPSRHHYSYLHQGALAGVTRGRGQRSGFSLELLKTAEVICKQIVSVAKLFCLAVRHFSSVQDTMHLHK